MVYDIDKKIEYAEINHLLSIKKKLILQVENLMFWKVKMKFLIPLIMVIELFYMILKGMKYLLIKKMFMGFPGKRESLFERIILW